MKSALSRSLQRRATAANVFYYYINRNQNSNTTSNNAATYCEAPAVPCASLSSSSFSFLSSFSFHVEKHPSFADSPLTSASSSSIPFKTTVAKEGGGIAETANAHSTECYPSWNFFTSHRHNSNNNSNSNSNRKNNNSRRSDENDDSSSTSSSVVASHTTRLLHSAFIRPPACFSSPLSCSSFSFSPCIALTTAARHYTNALVRLPPEQTIPTHNSAGEEIDAERFLQQFNRMLEVLQMTTLVEHIHKMRGCPYYESMFTADLLFQHYDLIFPMPKFGREQRSSEMGETIRHMRACGATGDVNHALQDAKGARASGLDFLATKYAVFVGFGNDTCNRVTADVLSGSMAPDEGSAKTVKAANFIPVELPAGSPPLGELVSFAGSRTLIVSRCPAGEKAAEKITSSVNGVHWQTVLVEPECNVCTFLGGARDIFDVLVDEDFPLTLETLGEAGLNPFAVEWSEPRKLGVSLKRVLLIGRFVRGSMSGGGYANHTGHQHTEYNYRASGGMDGKNARLFANGHRVRGDYGGSYLSQIRSAELYSPVQQSPPRYAPPMHRPGAGEEEKEKKGRGESNVVPTEKGEKRRRERGD